VTLAPDAPSGTVAAIESEVRAAERRVAVARGEVYARRPFASLELIAARDALRALRGVLERAQAGEA
jgi:hypothetical protein